MKTNFSSLENHEFHELIALARQGNENAIAELLERYRNYLLLIANQDSFGGSMTLAD